MATATNFDAWLDDVDGDYEEVMALYDSVLNVSDMGLYQCVEGGRGDAWVLSSNHHPEALFLHQLWLGILWGRFRLRAK